jgi:hypothetical protein
MELPSAGQSSSTHKLAIHHPSCTSAVKLVRCRAPIILQAGP